MPHTNRTKLLLAQSLQELMTAQPLEKITVNDIVEHAGVGRNTFYYHFVDKYDLVNWYFKTGVIAFFTANADNGWASFFTELTAYFRENRVFYLNALQYSGQNSLREYMYSFLYELFRKRAEEIRPDLSDNELNFIASFFSGGNTAMILSWIKNGMKSDIDEYHDLLYEASNGNLGQQLLDADNILPHLAHILDTEPPE